MPTYSFSCSSCNESFDTYSTIANRDNPTNEPCPLCGKEKCVSRLYDTPPSMAMDYNHRIDRPHNVGGFRDAIERICEAPGVKGTQAEKTLRQKHTTR